MLELLGIITYVLFIVLGPFVIPTLLVPFLDRSFAGLVEAFRSTSQSRLDFRKMRRYAGILAIVTFALSMVTGTFIITGKVAVWFYKVDRVVEKSEREVGSPSVSDLDNEYAKSTAKQNSEIRQSPEFLTNRNSMLQQPVVLPEAIDRIIFENMHTVSRDHASIHCQNLGFGVELGGFLRMTYDFTPCTNEQHEHCCGIVSDLAHPPRPCDLSQYEGVQFEARGVHCQEVMICICLYDYEHGTERFVAKLQGTKVDENWTLFAISFDKFMGSNERKLDSRSAYRIEFVIESKSTHGNSGELELRKVKFTSDLDGSHARTNMMKVERRQGANVYHWPAMAVLESTGLAEWL